MILVKTLLLQALLALAPVAAATSPAPAAGPAAVPLAPPPAAAQEAEPAEELDPLEQLALEMEALDAAALEAEIERLSAEVEAANAAADEATTALAGDKENADLQAADEAAQAALTDVTDRLSTVCDVAETKGVDVGPARALLISVVGIDASTLDAGALSSLAEQWLEDGKTWVVDNAPGFLVRTVAFLLVVALFWLLSGVAARLTGRALASSKLKITDLLRQFFVGLVSKIVFFLGLLFAFRTVVGVYFAWIYTARGFGIAVGCHTAYDLMVIALRLM